MTESKDSVEDPIADTSNDSEAYARTKKDRKHSVIQEQRFNYNIAKVKILNELQDAPGRFKKFSQTNLFDKLLNGCLLYFVTLFQAECLQEALDRAKKQHLDGYDPDAIAIQIEIQNEEAHQYKQDLSPLYAQIIMKYSTYRQSYQDRLFFENLYTAIINMMEEAFQSLKKRDEIEVEVGQLFRSHHFNNYKRFNSPPRSVDTLSVRELHAIKNETTNRALNAKLICSLFEKPGSLAIQVASNTNSPLVTQFIQSPIVARAMMKDPKMRKQISHAKSSIAAAHSSEPSTTNNGVKRPRRDRRKETVTIEAPSTLRTSSLDATVPKLGDAKVAMLDRIKNQLVSSQEVGDTSS